MPTLILHGDDDQIVPIADSALLSSKIVKGATLKVYEGAPHGMCTTLKDEINAELLSFLERAIEAAASSMGPALRSYEPPGLCFFKSPLILCYQRIWG